MFSLLLNETRRGLSIYSSCSTFEKCCSSSSLTLNQQTPQSFIIPLSLFQWRQSTVTVFPYCCRRPRFSFIPSLSPYNILPSLTTFFKSQINTSKTTVITLNIVLALSQAVIIIIPPSFLLHPGNYTQLFLNPVCCFLLLFLSIHLSLSFFSFSSLVCLSSLTLRLSLYLSLRWLLRRGNG